MLGFKRHKRAYYTAGGLFTALLLFLFATCSSTDQIVGCPMPEAGTAAAADLMRAQDSAGFAVVYPCTLPAAERLENVTIVGEAGSQRVELIFDGPFDMTIRQSQFPPRVTGDPAGASRIDIDLFPNVRASLIERNDGTSQALYHLFWEQGGLYYELQAFGPPLQRQAILEVARSLE